jgi:CP family cyanate transporter-like MFS transporter
LAAAEASLRPAWIVVLAGVSAALHVGKLPPAIVALQLALGVTLLEAGFLLSLMQLAGMSMGLAFGVLADGLGLKRSMLVGLSLLGAASVLGGTAQGAPGLLALRAVEGFGFLLAVLPAPGLLRQLVPPARVNLMMGVWGSYMPFGTATALLLGPWCIATFGWRAWWWLLGAASLAMAAVLWRAVPAPVRPGAAARTGASPWLSRVRRTLSAPGPWLVALAFAAYSGQWLAVIGFLPTVYARAGVAVGAVGALTAAVAAANMLGNLASGRLMHRGVAPTRLLFVGFAVMGLMALAAFAQVGGFELPARLRFAAVLVFSAVGGVVPATLFALGVRLAPGEDTISTSIGWLQQWSSFGQFAMPPLVAWVASRAGGWQWTGVLTGGCALLGWLLTQRIRRLLHAPAGGTRPG